MNIGELEEFIDFISKKNIMFFIMSDSEFFKDSFIGKVYDLEHSAISKYGEDPIIFRKRFTYFTNLLRKECKEILKHSKYKRLENNIGYLYSYAYSYYINTLIAIFLVDQEKPGFIKNFSEAIEYRYILNGGEEYFIKNKIENLIENILKNINRYSGRSENLDKLKKKYNIIEKEEKKRADDFIAKHLKLILSKEGVDKEKLISDYTYQNTLLPSDFQNILIEVSNEVPDWGIDIEK
jgi:hypothetical protein